MTDEPIEEPARDGGPGGHLPPPKPKCAICGEGHATTEHPTNGGGDS